MRWTKRVPGMTSLSAVLLLTSPLPGQKNSTFASGIHRGDSTIFVIPHFIFTPHPWLTSSRIVHASLSFETRSRWHAPLSGLQGTLRRLAFLRFDFGVAKNVTLQIRGAVQQELAIDAMRSVPQDGFPVSGTTRDAGDFSVATMIRLYSDQARKTALGFQVEAKLPNTTQSKGIGPNTTDIHLSVLASRQIGPVILFGDLGIGILTAPRALDEQNDVLRYGLGAGVRLTPAMQFAAEINGYRNTRNTIPLGTETRGVVRGGTACLLGEFLLETALLHGLTTNEGGWGGSLGVRRAFYF